MTDAQLALEEKRDQLIEAMLPHVPFDGWTRAALYMGAEDINLSRKEADRILPGGPVDLILQFYHLNTVKMNQELAMLDLPSMKIRERIATAVKTRILLNKDQKDAVRKAMSVMAMPQNAIHSTKAMFSAVDAMWYAAGDNATDWNYYSKRGLLSGVYSSTLLYWLDDKSENHQATWEFLDRRIGDVMKIPQLKAKATGILNKLSELPKLRRSAINRMKVKA
ncbi:COQ9 family protein [Curvivirga aplysinae]|uniref:COQ9 family protein n=1 Tax=Curvivirga aplysinae TaxID=2529852 RepID=UPI0012BD18A0|nr:COQ9 family protein [Curvivirga aplysinae]MTI09421.1 COQ9 family protein [Curvivirga aplysinae]